MSKIDFLRRTLLGCFTVTTTANTATTETSTTTTTKKRLSTSLRDDILFESLYKTQDSPSSCSSLVSIDSNDDDDNDNKSVISQIAPPRQSKSMVICTFFGHRGGSHVWFCVQLNRLSLKPSLLLELSLSTRNLVQEMRCGLLCIALECSSLELSSCPLHSVPVWTMFCNGRRVGFATLRKPSKEIREMLKKMQNITMGAGVIVAQTQGEKEQTREELMYMRANYEWVVGGPDSESFNLISPDHGPDQELSVFLLRSSV